MESDRYDEDAVFLGVFDENKFLAAFIRLITSPNPFMLDNEFSFLIKPCSDQIYRVGTGEISRLCVDPKSRGTAVSCAGVDTIIAMMVFKGLYLWCGKNNISFLYAVTEPKTQRLFFMKGIPLRVLGTPRKMPDGVTAIAVTLDWREFLAINESRRPELVNWFNQSRSLSSPRQPQRLASSLSRRVFSSTFECGK